MHNGERAVIAGGVVGGLLVGVFLFKGGISAGKTDAIVVAVPATSPSTDALSPDPEVNALNYGSPSSKRSCWRNAWRSSRPKQRSRPKATIRQQTDKSTPLCRPKGWPWQVSCRGPRPPSSRSLKSPAQEIETPPRRSVAEQPAPEEHLCGTGDSRLLERVNDMIGRESAMRARPRT